jgi:hypothetical protein
MKSTKDGGPERTRLDPLFPQQPPGQLANANQPIEYIEVK